MTTSQSSNSVQRGFAALSRYTSFPVAGFNPTNYFYVEGFRGRTTHNNVRNQYTIYHVCLKINKPNVLMQLRPLIAAVFTRKSSHGQRWQESLSEFSHSLLGVAENRIITIL